MKCENIDGTNWAEMLGLCHHISQPLTETGQKMNLYRKTKEVYNEENPDVGNGVDRIACHQ